jgi:hypothetical protein
MILLYFYAGWIAAESTRKKSEPYLIWPHRIEKDIFTIMPFIRKQGYFFAKKNPFRFLQLLIVAELVLATQFTYQWALLIAWTISPQIRYSNDWIC